MRLHRWLPVALALFTAGSASAAPRRVLVLPLRNLGVGDDVAASLGGFLNAEIAKLPGIALVTPKKAAKDTCKGELACEVKLAAKLGVDEVVSGTVAGLGDAYTIDLKRLVASSGKESGRVTETLSGQQELLIDGVRAAAYKLLLPEQYVGSISLDLKEKGAEVFVDGKLVGKTPLKSAIRNLAPGSHALKIVLAGFADFDRFVDVKFARTSVVKVDLQNSAITGVMYEDVEPVPLIGQEPPQASLLPPPPLPLPPPPVQTASAEPNRLPAYIIGGSGLALIGAGAVFGVLSRSAASEAKSLSNNGAVSPSDATAAKRALNRTRTDAIAANVLLGVGAAAVVTGGVLFALPLFDSDTKATVAPSSGGASVSLSGRF